MARPASLRHRSSLRDLHVARQHHQLGIFGLHDFELALLHLRLGGRRDWDVVKRHVVAGSQLVEIAVVADDGADVQRQQPAFPAEQQVVQAVALLADHDDRAHGLCCGMQLPLQVQGCGKGGQVGFELFVAELAAGKLHAHEEQAGVVVVELRGFFDVAGAFQQKAGHRMHQTQAVGA
jgi:hypothetical protein